MRDWPWQKWVGKVILLVLSAIALVIDQLGVSIPLWMIILPAATQVAQWFLGWIPGDGWQVTVGRLVLLVTAVVEIVLGGLGVSFELWLVLVPVFGAVAQYLIGDSTPVRTS